MPAVVIDIFVVGQRFVVIVIVIVIVVSVLYLFVCFFVCLLTFFSHPTSLSRRHRTRAPESTRSCSGLIFIISIIIIIILVRMH